MLARAFRCLHVHLMCFHLPRYFGNLPTCRQRLVFGATQAVARSLVGPFSCVFGSTCCLRLIRFELISLGPPLQHASHEENLGYAVFEKTAVGSVTKHHGGHVFQCLMKPQMLVGTTSSDSTSERRVTFDFSTLFRRQKWMTHCWTICRSYCTL